MNNSALKSLLRKKLLHERLALNKEELQMRSEELTTRFQAHFSFEHKHISCFATMKTKKEVDIFQLLEVLSAKNRIYLPVSDFTTGIMDHYPYSPGDPLANNPYGIPEPQNRAKSIDPKTLDVILVPLLGIDLQGNRLGYGKGFYDRFLTQCRPDALKIGLNLFAPIDHIPSEATDIPLDFLVTHERCYTFKIQP